MPGEVSELLARWSGGDREALDELMPLVYDEMRSLGRRYLASRRGNVMLQPTVLIHEAWIRLAGREDVALGGRLQFFALSGKIIRDILTDHYRSQRAVKRGGSQMEVPLDAAEGVGTQNRIDFLALNEAIDRLALIKPRYAQIIELRFFAGLTVKESAELLQVSDATIEREWTFTRLWLRRALKGRE